MSHTKVFVHLVWSTKNRAPMMSLELRRDLFSHIHKYAISNGIQIDRIGGYSDHVHVLLQLDSEQTLARVAKLLKGESSAWVNRHQPTEGRFAWQDQYFAVSVGRGQVAALRKYIEHQEEHHQAQSFADEYKMLEKALAE